MDQYRNDEKLASEPPPPEFSASPIHDRTASMNLGSPPPPNANGDEVSPVHGDFASQQPGPPPPPAADPNAKVVHEVVNSEVWDQEFSRLWGNIVLTLMGRLAFRHS